MRTKDWQGSLEPWLLLAPMLIIFALVTAWPLVTTLWFSFTNAQLDESEMARFIGFGNYIRMMNDARFVSALGFTAYYTIIVTIAASAICE